MEDMHEKHAKALEREGWVDEPELENRERPKLPASVLKQRAVYKAKGIITSAEETEDTFYAGLAVKPKPQPPATRITPTSCKQVKTD